MPKAEINGIELAYEIYGDGTPLVLAHGFTATKEMWDDQIGPFSEKYRVVVYDVRGHGASGAPPAEDNGYTLDGMVEDQKKLMEHLGIDTAYVGGLSMGGMIAMRFAIAYPNAVRALLLFDTAAGMAGEAEGQRRVFAENREAMEALARREGAAAVMRNLYAQRAESMGVSNPDELPAGVQRHIRGLETMTGEGFVGAGRALWNQESVLERLDEIRAPTLILVGDKDFLRGPSEEMHERIPDSRFVLMRRASHGTCLWRPEAFTEATLSFLSSVDAGQQVAGREER